MIRLGWLIFFLSFVVAVSAQPIANAGRLASIRVHTSSELSLLLGQVEVLRKNNEQPSSPILFVLHGDEVRSFLKSSYDNNQSLIDQSAKLTALGSIQIEVCETWLGANELAPEDLQPFVRTVPFGPARIFDLIENKNYTYF